MSASSSQKLRRNGSPSTNKSTGPLRATIPVSLMSQSVIHDVPEDASLTSSSQIARSKINPPHASATVTSTTNSNILQCGILAPSPWRLRQWSPTPKENYEAMPKGDDAMAPVIRRTASLDAIYLKGQWPRGTVDYGSNLLVDKSTQTPEEWLDMKRFSYRGVEFTSPSRDRKQKQRLLLGHQAHNPPPFQQYSSGSVSPNRVAASTNTEQHPMTVMSDRKETSRAIPMPSPPTSQSSRARNSVEGFNTEIEKLVMRGNETPSNKMMEPTPDGHRAPIAELFKHNTCRSVDTQTPVNAYSTNSSSGTSSPCGSVSPSVWGVFDHHHSSSRPPSGGTVEEIGEYNSLSPEDFQGLSLGTSPRGRFLCREPPDGCEKVETLKVVEHPVKNGQDVTSYCPPKPSAQFVLQPSSSSAFCSLNKLTCSAVKSSSSSHLFHANIGPHGSNLEVCDRSSSVPPQWPVQLPSVQIPATSSGQAN